MNFIERVMRVMTHINIGAALGLAAWVLWSGWQVVTGQIAPAYRPDGHFKFPHLWPVKFPQGGTL